MCRIYKTIQTGTQHDTLEETLFLINTFYSFIVLLSDTSSFILCQLKHLLKQKIIDQTKLYIFNFSINHQNSSHCSTARIDYMYFSTRWLCTLYTQQNVNIHQMTSIHSTCKSAEMHFTQTGCGFTLYSTGKVECHSVCIKVNQLFIYRCRQQGLEVLGYL